MLLLSPATILGTEFLTASSTPSSSYYSNNNKNKNGTSASNTKTAPNAADPTSGPSTSSNNTINPPSEGSQFAGFMKEFCAAHCSTHYPPPAPPVMPKLQVFKKDGHYFALDSNVLKLYQALQTGGMCEKVKVDVVPKKRIPKPLWDASVYDMPIQVETDGLSDLSESCSSDSEECVTDIDDELVCNACMASFPSVKQLTDHQVSKRHYGCCSCGEVFNTLSKLEEHKTVAGHGSTENLSALLDE